MSFNFNFIDSNFMSDLFSLFLFYSIHVSLSSSCSLNGLEVSITFWMYHLIRLLMRMDNDCSDVIDKLVARPSAVWSCICDEYHSFDMI